MNKVILDYDPQTGAIYNPEDGLMITTYIGLSCTGTKDSINTLRNLKESGFTVEEIIQLKREGLV